MLLTFRGFTFKLDKLMNVFLYVGLVGGLGSWAGSLPHTFSFLSVLSEAQGRVIPGQGRGGSGAGSGHCWLPSRRMVVPRGLLLGEEAEPPGPLPLSVPRPRPSRAAIYPRATQAINGVARSVGLGPLA